MLTAKPLVSIIVPSYNHARFLGQCLDSVLQQTANEWELILVDDLSTDGSIDVARSFDDSRIKVFVNESNLGTYGTQNRAVELSSGEWVAVLNSDDFWAPDKLAKQLAAIEAAPQAVVCYCNGYKTDESGHPYRGHNQHQDWPREATHELAHHLLESNHALASGVMFRKDVAQFETSLRYSGDWLALFRATYAVAPAWVDEPIVYWRQHGTNSSQSQIAVGKEEIRLRRALIDTESWFRTPRFDQTEVDFRLGMCHLHLASRYLQWGAKREARGSLKKVRKLTGGSRLALSKLIASFLPQQFVARRLFPECPAGMRWSEYDGAPLELMCLGLPPAG